MAKTTPDIRLDIAAPDPGFGVYVHWPFCLSKCPYCDFNSHVRDRVDHARWQAALLAELGHFSARANQRPVTSIFFGGGTPSLMPPELVAALIDGVKARFGFSPDIEITLEANPTSVEADRFQAFRDAGVNRVSLGVQSLRDDVLKFLGRGHDVGEALAAVRLARRIFPRMSFDLIYARPGQTAGDWRAELGAALGEAVDHLSLYQLTIEPNTGFAGAYRRGAFTLPGEEEAAALYEATQDVMDAAGLPAYEISNHARPGAESRHNLTYWRYGDYLGIGPGAHGRLTVGGDRLATRQLKKPEIWLEAVEGSGAGGEAQESVNDPVMRAEEALMMGLRLIEGVWFDNFRAVVGRDFDALIDPARAARLIDGGFLVRDARRIRATRQGLAVLNAVIAELF